MSDWHHAAKRSSRSKKSQALQANLGATIKLYRTRLGITQAELAWRSDMHRTYLADIERGDRNITLKSLAQLALGLQVSVGSILAQAEAEPGAASSGAAGWNACGGPIGDVLLVEDDDAAVELTLRSFKRARLVNPVQVMRDGDEAIAYLFGAGDQGARAGSSRPLLILLDLILPKISGLDVLRRIKADAALRAIPVVMLSGPYEDRDMVECARLGAASHLIKPLVFENFSKVAARLQLNWALLKSGATEGPPPPLTIAQRIPAGPAPGIERLSC